MLDQRILSKKVQELYEALAKNSASINQSINQSIFYLVTCRPGTRKLVQNTNVGYKILHGKMYIKIRKQYKKY